MQRTLHLDGNAFDDLAGFYDEVERQLTRGLDWRIGRNLDAFNDVLRGGFGRHDYGQPLRLVWLNAAKSRADFGHPATAAYWAAIAEHCHPTNREQVLAQAEQARHQQGPTLFEILITLIREHDLGHITLELR